MQCGVKMKTIINPFARKILGLDSFDKIQQNIKDYYKKWLALVEVYDPDAGNYYDDICEYLEKQRVPYMDFSCNEGDYIERTWFTWTDGKRIYDAYFAREIC